MQTNRMYIKPMLFKSLSVRWLLLAIYIQSAFSRPVEQSNKIRSPPVHEDVYGYLTKFGYLPESDLATGNLQTVDQLHDALRTLQTYGNIPVTGKLDAETKELMRKSRCGVPDVTPPGRHRNKRYTLHGQKWQHVNLTWSLRTRHLERMDHGWVRSDLHKALEIWSKHSKLTFREINSETADILVYFEKGYHGDGYPFDGRGQVLAHAFFPGTGHGGDAHFDVEEDWLLNGEQNNEGTSLYTVAAHEFGHSLGLAHSSVGGALMSPWYQGLQSDFELPDDDRLGIQVLYDSKNDKKWGNIPVYRPAAPRPNYPNTIPPRTTVRTTTSSTSTTTPRTTTTYTNIRTRQPDIPPANDKPDFCNTTFDAVSIIRKDLFFFKGKYSWRLGDKGLYSGYPALISRLWYNLPEDMNQVDAVYERQDHKIVFFIGRSFYVFNGNILVPGYPKPLTALGLPERLDHVDAVTVWGHNSKTYIFSGTEYWRYDDETDRMELGYPRDIMTIWKGVGYNLNAAFQWHDGATYFLKNRGFWKFNDLRMRVEQEEPRSIGEFWFNCTTTTDGGKQRPPVRSKGRVTVVTDRSAGRGGRLLSEAEFPGEKPSSAAIANGLLQPTFLSLLVWPAAMFWSSTWRLL
uniref:Matrix metalloproteinase-17 n=1 Tax=Sipha flava TaxID=143950 RepID=A0A2S2Q4U3_9HEMI